MTKVEKEPFQLAAIADRERFEKNKNQLERLRARRRTSKNGQKIHFLSTFFVYMGRTLSHD